MPVAGGKLRSAVQRGAPNILASFFLLFFVHSQDPFQGLRPERLPNGSWPWEVLEAEFGTARRFNQQVEEQVSGCCRWCCCCPTSALLLHHSCSAGLLVLLHRCCRCIVGDAVGAATAAGCCWLLPIRCCLDWNLQVRKGIALPIGDEDWLKPEMLAQLSLTGLRQVCCAPCACCGVLGMAGVYVCARF